MIPREVLCVWAEHERDRRAANRILAVIAGVVLAVIAGYAWWWM